VQLLQRVLDGREETLGPDAEYAVWTREKLEYLKQTGTFDGTHKERQCSDAASDFTQEYVPRTQFQDAMHI